MVGFVWKTGGRVQVIYVSIFRIARFELALYRKRAIASALPVIGAHGEDQTLKSFPFSGSFGTYLITVQNGKNCYWKIFCES